MPQIDDAIQQAQGAIGAVVGQTYDVFRMTNTTSGSILNGPALYTGFPLSPAKAQKKHIENTTFDLQVFVGTCDNRDLEIGDVLVETGYEALENNIFIFAQRRPMGVSLFVRGEVKGFISRPNTGAGSSSQQTPGSGVVVDDAWGGTYKGIEEYLTLTNGVYTFQSPPDASTGATLPIGLQPLNRVRDGTIPKVPTIQYRTHHLAFVPMLNGEQLNEQDRINASSSDRYEIMEVYASADAGLDGGYILIVEKTAV